ncbi:flavin monoamine oxidase family protein [Caulobacter sp. RL271]|jgi:monoamine oxidase|uniref:Tryptophan 2-monooxygenase n=1 Tax=Caulobacter segnis TaxID=88688 RepID=A0ABY4ZTP9_9CAUL|nr:NAD(P)/FAD-dependent oxidoreductase [Caulobacter segnis]USQ96106.1 FAD-dependent oxidoreductase [Caulobacter segnis]
MDEVDIAIVGAGAAGLAAAEIVAASGLTGVVLEARDRLGGRAHTIQTAIGPIDLGCEWLHSADRNPLVARVEALGLTLDKTPPPWANIADNPVFTRDERAAFGEAFTALDARLDAAARAGGPDRPASDLMDPDSPWTPLLNAFSAFYNGAEFDQVSLHDYAAYEDTEVNWRVAEGYGTAIAGLGGRLSTRLSCPVTMIRHGGPRVTLETPQGDVTARAVIVCAPTAILATGALRFMPALPDKLDAAAGLPLGLADKVFLRLQEPEMFPPETQVYGDPHTTATGAYHLRPLGKPIIEVFLGGAHARALEGQGPGAAAAFAIDELVGVYGGDIRAKLHVLAETHWAADPFAGGSYSHALPGHAGARAVLAEPVDQRLFFAGEACSPNFFSTAHGAWQTGQVAARAAVAALTA